MTQNKIIFIWHIDWKWLNNEAHSLNVSINDVKKTQQTDLTNLNKFLSIHFVAHKYSIKG